MKTKISFEKILCFFLALGVCFIFRAGNYKLGDYLIQQFFIIIPSLFLLCIYIIINTQHNLNVSLFLLIIISIIIFLITSFKFGIENKDFLSLMGFLILPIMIILFNNIKSKEFFIYYYIAIFTVLEIIAITWLINNRAIFNIWDTVKLRGIFYVWPNYFSMLSVIKYGCICIMKKKNISLDRTMILSSISIATVFLSLSRTGIFMLIIVFIINNLLNYKSSKAKHNLYKKVNFIIILVVLILIAYKAIGFKSLSAAATIERTIKSRTNTWISIIETAKENIILGTGFRSTIKYIGNNLSSSHNDYIDFLLKGGVVGFTMIYGFFLHRIIILFKKEEYEVLSVIISILAGSFVQNPLKNISIMVLFAFMLSYSYPSNNTNYD